MKLYFQKFPIRLFFFALGYSLVGVALCLIAASSYFGSEQENRALKCAVTVAGKPVMIGKGYIRKIPGGFSIADDKLLNSTKYFYSGMLDSCLLFNVPHTIESEETPGVAPTTAKLKNAQT